MPLLQDLIFALIIAAIAIFLLVYLPYKNGKSVEIADMVPIDDDYYDNARELCEEYHRNAWQMLTKEEQDSVFTHYCLVCERYR